MDVQELLKKINKAYINVVTITTKENKLATGAKGNSDRGLTEDGAKLIKKT